jgi:Tripartite tricarboxylate transporter family receptor
MSNEADLPQHFDLLLQGATLITGDAHKPLLRDASLGIRKGRIVWLGESTAPGHSADRCLALAGHVITPGFVNPHQHAVLSMVRGSARRSSLVPDLPTLAEAGLPGYDFSAWFVLLAPAGTPPAVVNKLNQQVQHSLAAADVKERYAVMGAEPGQGSPAELQAFIGAEIKRYAQLVKATGMKVE